MCIDEKKEDDTVTDEPPKNERNFWNTDRIHEYDIISSDLLPSDIPAYAVAISLLNPVNKRILDFGCFHGHSSENVLQAGAAHVTGCDKDAICIEIAREKYGNTPGLDFVLLEGDESIPIPDESSYFDGVIATFVHPTIKEEDELKQAFERIFKVLKQGGAAVFLGLHPNIFGQDFSFNNYAPTPTEDGYNDGKPFHNVLRKPDGTVLEFDDYCWTEATMEKLLLESGFSTVDILALTEQNLQETELMVFSQACNKVQETYGIDLRGSAEFTVPLYQIFIARK